MRCCAAMRQASPAVPETSAAGVSVAVVSRAGISCDTVCSVFCPVSDGPKPMTSAATTAKTVIVTATPVF